MKPGISEIEPSRAALATPAQPAPLPQPGSQDVARARIEENTDQDQNRKQGREDVQEHLRPFFQSGQGLAAVGQRQRQ